MIWVGRLHVFVAIGVGQAIPILGQRVTTLRWWTQRVSLGGVLIPHATIERGVSKVLPTLMAPPDRWMTQCCDLGLFRGQAKLSMVLVELI